MTLKLSKSSVASTAPAYQNAGTTGGHPSEGLGLLALVPFFWFGLAQGTKRCHDRGNPGIFMIIPFYGLWMLFADSEPGTNEYGPNPKEKTSRDV